MKKIISVFLFLLVLNIFNVSFALEDESVFIHKSAKWVDEDKTLARVKIELETYTDYKNMDVIFIIDSSGSCAAAAIPRAQKAAEVFLEDDVYFSEGNRIAVVCFNTLAYPSQRDISTGGADKFFDTDTKTVLNKIANIPQIKKEGKLGYYANTNFDAPFSVAEKLFNNRTGEYKNNRKLIIIFSDGEPIPFVNYPKKEYGGLRVSSSRDREANNNQTFIKTAERLKKSGVEIYFAQVQYNDDKEDNGPKKEAAKPYLWGDICDSREKIVHVYTKDGPNILKDYIQKNIGRRSNFEATVTDVINHDKFEYVSNLANVKTNINSNTVSFDKNTNKISWKINGIRYGQKVNGEWPYLEFTIKLKYDESKPELKYQGELNTNYIKNLILEKTKEKSKWKKEDDDACVASTNSIAPNYKKVIHESPWLDRRDPGEITVNLILSDAKTGETIIPLGKSESHWVIVDEPEKISYTDYGKKLNLDFDNYNYKGYEIVDGKIDANSIKKIDPTRFNSKSSNHLNSSGTAKVTTTEQQPKKTLNFYFVPKTAKVKYIHGYYNLATKEFVVLPNDGNKIYTKEETISYSIDKSTKKIKDTNYSATRVPYESNFKYIGYDVYDSAVYNQEKYKNEAMTESYNMKSTSTKATVTFDKSHNYWLIVFVYQMPNPLNLKVEVVHYNKSLKEEMFRPRHEGERTSLTLSTLIESLEKEDEVQKEIDIILASKKSEVEKASEILKAVKNCKFKSGQSDFKSLGLGVVNGSQRDLTRIDVEISKERYEIVANEDNRDLKFKVCDGEELAKLEREKINPSTVVAVPLSNLVGLFENGSLKYESKDDILTIRYVYDLGQKLTVRYIDIDTGVELSGEKIRSFDYGNEAEEAPLSFVGYNLAEEKPYEFNPNTIVPRKDDTKLRFDMNQDIVLTFYYRKIPKFILKVKHLDIDTNAELLVEAPVEYDAGTPVTKYPIFNYTGAFDGYKYANAVKASPSSIKLDKDDVSKAVSFNMTQNIELIFYYKKEPEIFPTIIPLGDPQIGDPSGNPESPYNDPRIADKVIILDEKFEVELEVKNYNKIKKGKILAKFPFDVYCFEADDKIGDLTGTSGHFVKANELITLEEITEEDYEARRLDETKENVTFYYYFRLPSWIIEKVPKIQPNGSMTNCYTVEISLDATIGEDEPYPIEKKIGIGVIGTLYDFTITNVNEGNNNNWQRVLFAGENLGREYKADTLPIAQEEIKPNISTITDPNTNRNNKTKPSGWNNELLLGGKFLFSINTKGLYSDSIKIESKLTYFDVNGEEVSNVSYKFNNNGSVGSDFTDNKGKILQVGKHFVTALNESSRASDEVRYEIFKATTMMAINEKFNVTDSTVLGYRNLENQYKSPQFTTKFDFGSYGRLIIPKQLRLPYANYMTNDLYRSEVNRIGRFINTSVSPVQPDVKEELQYIDTSNYRDVSHNQEYLGEGKIKDVEMDELKLINSLGHWYAEYALPADLEVYDTNGNRLEKGTILVSFKISTIDKDKYTYLSYSNTQWNKENSAIYEENGKKYVNISIVGANDETKVDITDGYYPVALYSTHNIEYVVSGNTH